MPDWLSRKGGLTVLIAGIVVLILSLLHLSVFRDYARRERDGLPYYNYHELFKATWFVEPIGIVAGIVLIILGLVR